MLTTLAAGIRAVGPLGADSWARRSGSTAGRGGLVPRAEIIDRHKEIAEQPVVSGHFGSAATAAESFRTSSTSSPPTLTPGSSAGNSPEMAAAGQQGNRPAHEEHPHAAKGPMSWAGSIRRYFPTVRPNRPRPCRSGGSQGASSILRRLAAGLQTRHSRHEVVEDLEHGFSVASGVVDLEHERTALRTGRGPEPQVLVRKKGRSAGMAGKRSHVGPSIQETAGGPWAATHSNRPAGPCEPWPAAGGGVRRRPPGLRRRPAVQLPGESKTRDDAHRMLRAVVPQHVFFKRRQRQR